MLGNLRSIFNGLGRLDQTNSVTHPRIKEYLQFVREEQAGLAVIPSQAVPFFFVKFQDFVAYLRGKFINGKSLSKIHKYILVRDATFFVVDFFTGNRASDLGRLLAGQVLSFKGSPGLFVKFYLNQKFTQGYLSFFRLNSFSEFGRVPG